MGDQRTATQRLNLAQAFNPIGSLFGMFVASKFILVALDSDKRNQAGELIFNTLDEAQKTIIRTHDLTIIRNPYVILGFVVIAMLILIAVTKMPKRTKSTSYSSATESFKRLFKNGKYKEGVLAQLFYVAAQIMCWTFIIQYAGNLGISKAEAQNYNIIAMSIFLGSRFISTFLMKYVNAKKLLMIFALCAMVTISGVILIEGLTGLYLLVATSAFMSLMFPTIYGIALNGLNQDDTTLGAAGLVMAIVGGALMPILQGLMIDMDKIGPFSGVNFSFILPFVCFCFIAVYGYRTLKVHK